MNETFAHSLPGHPETSWERLSDHLQATAVLASRHADAFGWARVGDLLGRLHDIGKVSPEFQAYIRSAQPPGQSARSVDHSTAGARAAAAYRSLARLLAYPIAGHHAGLADAATLNRRLEPAQPIPSFAGWEQHVGTLPDLPALKPTWPRPLADRHKGFSAAFLTRMLFSCLVDADFMATEAFYAAAEGRKVERGNQFGPEDLLARLRRFQAERAADPSALNTSRSEIRAHAVAKAALPRGPFTLTVPTGGGKTLTSLSFALEHAACHEMRRVVHVIPYTSIIEQTAAVFRQALGTADAVLEHHASFDWEAAAAADLEREAGQGPDAISRLRRAAENWDAPLVVTTAVQFFESLFAARTSRCRKLHNLARSVIVLDEAQNLPLRLLNPCLAALDELGRHYRASVVLCTATQPAVRRTEDEFAAGLELPADRELAPDPPALYAKLRRQRVARSPRPVDDAELARRFAEQPTMLCIVNSRRHAWDLFGQIRHLEGAVHLSTYMCPRHRSLRLASIKTRLGKGVPVRLVSTSLVEAGVDFSFPEVWRAEAGLDSVAQAAGRCNREGELSPELGRVVVFQPAGRTPPADLALPAQCAAGVMARFADPLAPDAIRAYFRELYWNRGAALFDAAMLEGKPFQILTHLAETARGLQVDFDQIARAFRMIDQEEVAVIVPWRASSDDRDAETILPRIAAAGPNQADLRALQRYAVPLPRRLYQQWLAQGVIRPAHPALGEAQLRFDDTALYDDATGIRVFDPAHRTSTDNLL